MGNHNIRLSINGKDNGASKVLSGVKASTIALGTAAGNLLSAGLTSAMHAARGWINAALESEKANIQLDAALRGTGQYSKELSKNLQDLAGTIQDEIGGSDEEFKGIISQLLTMGIAAEKVDSATRAVTALSAIGYKGARAMRAVARAVEGDYTAFNELIPAVKQAATEQEKLDAINRTIAAGYEQQQAQLGTVGGAWDALKGRLGDAQEAFTNAIFKGLGLSDTFGGMQKAVGEFLQSEKWNDFLDKLESAAAFARDLAGALLSTGGFKAVGIALGEVVLAAIKDGAEHLGHAIKEALKKPLKDNIVAEAGRWYAGMIGGLSAKDAMEVALNPESTRELYQSNDHLAKALENLKKTVDEQNTKTAENTAAIADNTKIEAKEKNAPVVIAPATPPAQQPPPAQQQAAQQRAAQQQQAQQQLNKAKGKRDLAWDEMQAAQRVLDQAVDPVDALERHNQEIAQQQAQQQANDKIMQRYENLKKRQKAAGNMKLRLSKKDQALVDAIDKELAEQAAAEAKKEEAQKRFHEAEREVAEAEAKAKDMAELAEDQLTELKQINNKINQALVIGS